MNIRNSLAQASGVDLGEKFGSSFGGSGGKGFGDLASLIVTIGITVAGIIVLFTFVFGGIKVIGSAGKDDPKGAGEGKQAITYAAIGFAVVLMAFFIIQALELITGNTFLTNPVFFLGG